MPYPHHQRLLDLLKALDLKWPKGTRFAIEFNDDVASDLTSKTIKTATISIHQDNADPQWDHVALALNDLPVGHA
jgi:hypothetical protein